MEVAARSGGASDDHRAGGVDNRLVAIAVGAWRDGFASYCATSWWDNVGGCDYLFVAIGHGGERCFDDGVHLARAETRAAVCGDDDVCGAGDCAPLGHAGP